jgi:hypothetical protein
MSFGPAYHFIFLDGVYLDRSAQGLKPKFVKLSAPSDADIAAVVAKLSQRVLRKLRGAITPPPRQQGIVAAACPVPRPAWGKAFRLDACVTYWG